MDIAEADSADRVHAVVDDVEVLEGVAEIEDGRVGSSVV